jgi:putative intracellular protease/amidase
MNKQMALSVLIAVGLALTITAARSKSAAAKVLIVLSSKNTLTLKDGATHPTGFYMNELGVPLKALIDAGFEPVFCDPEGNQPTMDKSSDKQALFKNEEEYKAVKALITTSAALKHPQTLAKIASGDLNQYSGIFIPGGHAPMEDLWMDASLGKILRHFHGKNQPTALICHGPIALLSTLKTADALVLSVEQKKNTPSKTDWLYCGYKMTVFSDAEEKPNEPGRLGGYMKFYPEDALKAAGGDLTEAPPKQSNVVQDRELITGQNPFSDKVLAAYLLKALGDRRKQD